VTLVSVCRESRLVRGARPPLRIVYRFIINKIRGIISIIEVKYIKYINYIKCVKCVKCI